MKTSKINNALKVLILTFSLFFISNRMLGQTPQCNVNIINNNTCTALIKIEWFDSSSPTVPCDTQTLTVVPNTPYNPSCSGTCNGTINNVRYTIIGGLIGWTGSGFVDINNQNDSGGTTCGGTGTYGLAWAPGTLTIQ